jgi:predicted nucleotidyltransferase
MRTLDQLDLSDNDLTAVRQAASILRERFPVTSVVLFGSKARGQATSESDIDLLVLTHEQVNHEQKRRMSRALFDLQLQRAVVINLLIVPAEDWERGLYQVLPIRREIEKEGVPA